MYRDIFFLCDDEDSSVGLTWHARGFFFPREEKNSFQNDLFIKAKDSVWFLVVEIREISVISDSSFLDIVVLTTVRSSNINTMVDMDTISTKASQSMIVRLFHECHFVGLLPLLMLKFTSHLLSKYFTDNFDNFSRLMVGEWEYLNIFSLVERDESLVVGGRGQAGRVFPVTSPLLLSPLMSGHLVSALGCLLSVRLSSNTEHLPCPTYIDISDQ